MSYVTTSKNNVDNIAIYVCDYIEPMYRVILEYVSDENLLSTSTSFEFVS